MGLYIKGMRMPESCGTCFVGNRTICKNGCPLVALPDHHGDLIDRKVLSGAVLKWMPPDPCGKEEKEFPFEEDICVSMMMEIEEQPTVIEAEDE